MEVLDTSRARATSRALICLAAALVIFTVPAQARAFPGMNGKIAFTSSGTETKRSM